MTNEKEKLLCEDCLRHAEYFGMQNTFDDLYTKSKSGEIFTNLMPMILSRENILLAYRNIKANTGSRTAGTDKLTMKDIGRLSPDEVVETVKKIVQGSPHGYRPKPVRRREIPKPYDPTMTRPLGIPCIWDRLVQQCVKQIMEPICEARFNDYSFGFRPNRAAEHAIAVSDRLMQRSHLHYVIEFDIKGFFDNVNHAKLIRQIWAFGIHDKHLIYILRQMLTAPIKLENGKIEIPNKGTPQGGILSPLLANIVLNELDWWVTSQWQNHPVADKYVQGRSKIGTPNKNHGFRAMRGTHLKEMYIVRYADDFRVFCRTLEDARRTKIAVTQWLSERLKLEVSQEKTKIVNVKRHYSDFLGFKMKVHAKGNKQVVKSHIADKNLKHKRRKLVEQAKRIARPRKEYGEQGEIRLYNSIVVGMQNYYQIATSIATDCKILNRAVMTVLTNRLSANGDCRLVRTGRKLTDFEKARYGQSAQLRFVRGSNDPVYPIGYTQYKCAMHKKRNVCCYSAEGRKGIHDNLRINTTLMLALMRQKLYGRSVEYADNRISHFSAQFGKCSVTGVPFLTTDAIHCHHILPKEHGGGDNYDNLTLVHESVHRLIHATQGETVTRYLSELKLNREQLEKLNKLREKAKLQRIIPTEKH